MIRTSCITVLIFFGIVFIEEGSSLRCYSCNSKTNVNCIDPARHRMSSTFCNKTALHDIKQFAIQSVPKQLADVYDIDLKHDKIDGPYDCVKQITKGTEDGKEVILRGCQVAIAENPKFCNKIETVGGTSVAHCSTCNSDECNMAPRSKSLNWLIITFVLFYIAFIK